MAKSRAYVFTLNNWSPEDEARVKDLGAQYYVYGKEVGESGTPHLQGFLYFKNQRTFNSLKKKLPTAHLEKAKNTRAAIEYCKKDGDYVEHGDPPQKNGGDSQEERALRNKRLREAPLNDLVDGGELRILDVKRLKQARDILAQEGSPYVAEDVRGVWIHGPPGTGKTHMARNEYGDVFYIKAQNKWFDGYNREKVIVLDDLDKGGSCLGHYLKIWADKWACSGEIKGGTVNLVHEKFIVTSNYTPSDLWPDDDEMRKAIERRFEMKRLLIKQTN